MSVSFALFVTLLSGTTHYSEQFNIHGIGGSHIAGIYNDPAGHSFQTIFLVDPGWAYEKPKPHDQKYWKDLQYRLHDIHVRQHESSWQLRCLCMAPVIITIVRHFLLAILCAFGTIELSLTICWYTVVYWHICWDFCGFPLHHHFHSPGHVVRQSLNRTNTPGRRKLHLALHSTLMTWWHNTLLSALIATPPPLSAIIAQTFTYAIKRACSLVTFCHFILTQSQ